MYSISLHLHLEYRVGCAPVQQNMNILSAAVNHLQLSTFVVLPVVHLNFLSAAVSSALFSPCSRPKTDRFGTAVFHIMPIRCRVLSFLPGIEYLLGRTRRALCYMRAHPPCMICVCCVVDCSLLCSYSYRFRQWVLQSAAVT